MKRIQFLITIGLALIFVLFGCTNPSSLIKANNDGILLPDDVPAIEPLLQYAEFSPEFLSFFSIDQIVKAREEVLVAGESADDPYALRDLDYIYVLGYAVDHWLLMGGEIYDRSYITGYTSSIEDAPGADSMIWMAREYVDTFKKIIDPSHYGSGIAPQPVIEGVYDGVYYEDLVFPENDPHEVSLTQFHWEYDG